MANLFITDSRAVGKLYNRTHKSCLTAIKRLPVTEEFRSNNFEQSSYVDSRGKVQRLINMTKDGERMLIRSFTARRSDLTTAHTYLLLADGLDRVKIGRATNFSKALTALQNGCPVPLKKLLLIKENIKQVFHKQHQHLSTGGDWFIYGQEIKDFIISKSV